MKPNFFSSRFIILASSVLTAQLAFAADRWWDGGVADIPANGNGASAGGAGTWDTTLLNWDAGASPHVAWNNLNNDTAIFAGTAGEVSLGTGITAGGLTFSTTGYSVTGNTLTLAGGSAPIINVTTGTTTISSQISGSVGLQKSGAGTLVLGNASNNFTGVVSVNAGQVTIAANGNLGDAANDITFGGNAKLLVSANNVVLGAGRTITVNSGSAVMGDININNNPLNFTIDGQITGDGGIQLGHYQLGTGITNLNSTANDFKGALILGTSSNHSYSYSGFTANVASLADGVGYGNIVFGRGNNSSANTATFAWSNSATTALELDHRRIELDTTVEQSVLANNNSDTTRTITVNTDLLVSRAGVKTFTLSGSNTGANTFAGDIANGIGTVALTKSGAGTWALGGTNTYSGNTNLAAVGTTGRLIFQGSQSLSPNTKLVFAQSSSAVQSASFLDDGAGTINFDRPIEFGGTNTLQNLNIFVGNNNTANGGSGSGTTTNSTIQVGDITFTSVAGDTNTTTINATGANGYRLQTGTITLNNLVARNAGQTTVTSLNPTTANMTVAAITMAAGNAGPGVDGIPVLRLTGTAADNRVTGAISEAEVALALQKQGSSTWTLSGVNTFTGSTTISAGTLEIGGNGSLGAGNYAAGISVTGTSTLRFNSTADQTLSGVLNSASTAALIKNNTGTLTITNATNTLSGATTINGGTLAVNGSGTLGTSNVTIDGGTFVYNSSVAYSNILTFTNGTLGGTNLTGSLGGQTIGANQTLSPGNSPGTAATTSQTWADGGSYLWEVNDAEGTAGADPGWDLINGTGTLTITDVTADPFTILVTSLTLGNVAGNAENFDDLTDYEWLLADFASITGFSADAFDIDTSGFSNPFTGVFGISLGGVGIVPGDNSQIYLTYTAASLGVIPEPSTALLSALGLLALMRRKR